PTTMIHYFDPDKNAGLVYQGVWSPSFLRLTEHTGDSTYEMYARNAVVGRWSNYPGYYLTGFTDLPQDPKYPWIGPDETDIYYHHIDPHLTWTIDYLVSDAFQRSDGAIAFPFLRQYGYAYFDCRVYGHAPGQVFDREGAWLWFKRGLVRIDNPQINYLTAESGDRLFVILMSQSNAEEKVDIRFNAPDLGREPGTLKTAALLDPDSKINLTEDAASITLPPRGLAVLTLDSLDINVPTHRPGSQPQPGPHPAFAQVPTDANGITVRAAALQKGPGPWHAYIWCDTSADLMRSMVFHYQIGEEPWRQVRVKPYPYEITIPVENPEDSIRFRAEGDTVDGATVQSKEGIISAMR
ncbi:hypothetical protein HQ520_17620, partial [bacterium]|nr:hypothetical protein [bacterium]